jgi:hypothetical protein
MARRKRGVRAARGDGTKLVVRRARAEDREAILDLATRIWGGTDYLPLIWDRWLRDRKGLLLTATLDGRPVGVSKISVLAPGEVWLEGLRLHPDVQGRGLVRQINRVTFREAAKLNPRSVRYATGAGNAASRHLGEIRGFWMVARARWMWGPALTGGRPSSRRARPDEIDRVWPLVRDSECRRAMSGLQGVGWKFHSLDRRRLRRLISAGRVLVRPRTGPIRAVAAFDVVEIAGGLCLGYVDGSDDDVAALARDVLRLARDYGVTEVSAMLPPGRITAAVRGAGYDAILPADAVVYELGARGFTEDEEPFESLMWRTLRVNESEAAARLVDLLSERAARPVTAENVRDFLMRNVLPDGVREAYAAIEDLIHDLESWPLRSVLRGIARHFLDRYGIGGDDLRIHGRVVSFWYRGKRVAAARVARKHVTVTVGPGFGPCFDPDATFEADRVAFPERTRDRSSGLYGAVVLTLTDAPHVWAAIEAIDVIMSGALPGGSGSARKARGRRGSRRSSSRTRSRRRGSRGSRGASARLLPRFRPQG